MNNPYRSGTADYWYSGNKADLWIEYKWLKKIPTKIINLSSGDKPLLSALQQKWLTARDNEGRNVAVVVGFPEGAIILQKNMWLDNLNFNMLISRNELASWILEQTNNKQK